nr:MAG TPA: hypothetical protein [Caudoviricetes sp.]
MLLYGRTQNEAPSFEYEAAGIGSIRESGC